MASSIGKRAMPLPSSSSSSLSMLICSVGSKDRGILAETSMPKGRYLLSVLRMRPGMNNSIDWPQIGKALRDINYQKAVVMETFLLKGVEVGESIRV